MLFFVRNDDADERVGFAARRRPVHVGKVRNQTKSEKLERVLRRQSEKFKPKVRNWRIRAGKVRNSNQK
jgi:hypothetical protein